jgi:glucose-1-phosphate adenylyltransferase
VEGLGVLRVADDLSVQEFVEKPRDPAVIDGLRLGPRLLDDIGARAADRMCFTNMGIYVFDKRTLWSALSDPSQSDFSKEVIPSLLASTRMFAFPFTGYWRDIGTVRAFFEANLEMSDPEPPFNFFDPDRMVFTHPRFLPASRIHRCHIDRAIVADGCQIEDAELERCVIGVRSVINAGTRLSNVVMMGQDAFESFEERRRADGAGQPRAGIGRACTIANAIIDKNARIGDEVQLSPEGLPHGFERDCVHVRDGVLIVSKNGVVASGTRLGGATNHGMNGSDRPRD